MENKYLLLQKPGRKECAVTILKDVFGSAEKEFSIVCGKTPINCCWELTEKKLLDRNEKEHELLIICEKKTSVTTAKVLSLAEKKLRADVLNQYYFCIPLRLDSSLYFGRKMYCAFADVELGLREVYLRIIMQIYGLKWAKNVFSDEQIEDFSVRLKCRKSSDKINEYLLQELVFSELCDLLFTPFSALDPSELLNPGVMVELAQDKTPSEIENAIEKYRPASVWQRALQHRDSNEESIQEEHLNQIRHFRNDFAHYKAIDHETYQTFIEDIHWIKKEIQQVNSALDKDDFDFSEIAESLKTILEFNHHTAKLIAETITSAIPAITSAILAIDAISKSIAPALIGFSENVSKIVSAVQTPIFPSSILEAYQPIENVSSGSNNESCLANDEHVIANGE